MSSSNKIKIVSGLLLIVAAAFFSISLLLQVLDFGYQLNNFVYITGKMLFTVYGFSSIFIPFLLFLCGMICFLSQWTLKRIIKLITAIIPFLTLVFAENICKSILAIDSSSQGIIKVAITIVTGLMLVVIENIGVGIIFDKIYLDYIKSKRSEAEKKEDDEIKDDFVATEEFSETKEKSIFDEALERVKFSTEKKENHSDDSDIKDVLDSIDENVVAEIPSTESEDVEIAKDEILDDEKVSSSPQSMITKEEYAALMPQINEEESEVLEWPNLPTPPENLPPEYNDEEESEKIDENDPALQFPPVENVYNAFDVDLKSVKPHKEESPYDVVNQLDEYTKTSNDVTDESSKNEELAEENEIEQEESEISSETTLSEEPEIEDLNDELENTQNNQESEKDENIEEVEVSEENKQYDLSNSVESSVFGDKLGEIDETTDTNDNEATLDPDFFDIDLNEDEETESDEEKNEISDETDDITTECAEESDKSIELAEENVITNENKTVDLEIPSISTVFSDMENDIRKNQNSYFEETSLLENSDTIGASDLTADKLNDFFNAQQDENIPKTKEIEGNLPENNKARSKSPYVIPSDLLTAYKDDQYWIIDDDTKEASLRLKQTLSEFNIEADIIGIKKGPVVTMFELSPAPGVKLSKIVALQDNIALSLAASSVRIVAPIPGKQAVGIEVPNKERSIVSFRELIELDLPEFQKMSVPVILGKDILGKAQLIDLVKTPHMLIAGSTGSGKSVCVNSIILSILYKRSYKDVKLILIDPKVVELKLYNNIPHLLTPVITEPKKAFQALQYCLCEMERRYALLDGLGVRDISNYNKRIIERKICTEKLPYIVVIIDEFADLMATTGKELESIVARLAAMSRAVGIHLVLATQRPSVNVITGLIKANIPTRIAFMVASKTDSHIIIDGIGAEKLLGKGDMLYASAVDPFPIRIQGTFVSDQEVENVVDYVKQFGEPDYIDDEIFIDDEEENVDLFGNSYEEDPLYDQALDVVVQAGKASASYIQRRLKIGYNRAARLVEEMEERGIVGPANGSKPREIIHIP
jgi:DNA segregation ATPase FtsK/SpoIIIE, S-DNA-T family